MKNFLRIFVLFLVLPLSFSVPKAQACSCIIPGTPQEELEASSAVFAGKVLSKTGAGYGYRVTFEVSEAWKGVEYSEVDVETGFGGGDCGVNFEIGKSYLVYADASEGVLSANSCGRTTLLSMADADLQVLGEGATNLIEKPKGLDEAMLSGVALLVLGILGLAVALFRPKEVKPKKDERKRVPRRSK